MQPASLGAYLACGVTNSTFLTALAALLVPSLASFSFYLTTNALFHGFCRLWALTCCFEGTFGTGVNPNRCRGRLEVVHSQVWYFGSTFSKELGSACTKDRQCKVDNSQCSSGVCTCKHYHAQLGTTACLESKLLGRECTVSEQCSLRVANSTCKNGHCHCSEGFLRFRKHTCLGPAKVGDVCYSDEHCRLWAENSHCKFLIPKLFGKCACDGEGNCAPHGAAEPSALNPTITEDPQSNTGTPAEPSNEGRHPTPLAQNTSDDNNKPQTTNPLFVDPFLHQKEHLKESPLRPTHPHTTETPSDSTPLDTTRREDHSEEPTEPDPSVGEGTTEAESLQGHSPAPEALSEGSKYRVEANEKETSGIREEWENVDAVSLGYPCQSDAECQKRDGGSLCLNGVCDCAVKTNVSTSCGRDSTGCGPETFQCKDSGTCISWFFVCDGRNDCPDNSDEECQGPKCPSPSFQCRATGACVSLAAICDGVDDCPDGEDERLCSLRGRNSTQGCPDDSFQCANGQCLPKFEFCNAIPKCSDGSDESPHLCSSQFDKNPINEKKEYCPFQCGNGRCRSTAIVCSGRDGCGDNSDEVHCSVCRCPRLPTAN